MCIAYLCVCINHDFLLQALILILFSHLLFSLPSSSLSLLFPHSSPPPLPPSLLLPSPRAPVWELNEAEDEGIQADLQSMRSKVSDNRTSATSTLSEFSTG